MLEALTVHSHTEIVPANSVVWRYSILPVWKDLKYQAVSVCFKRQAKKNSTGKNMNGGILRKYSSSYWCKQNPPEKSIHNKVITFSNFLT